MKKNKIFFNFLYIIFLFFLINNKFSSAFASLELCNTLSPNSFLNILLNNNDNNSPNFISYDWFKELNLRIPNFNNSSTQSFDINELKKEFILEKLNRVKSQNEIIGILGFYIFQFVNQEDQKLKKSIKKIIDSVLLEFITKDKEKIKILWNQLIENIDGSIQSVVIINNSSLKSNTILLKIIPSNPSFTIEINHIDNLKTLAPHIFNNIPYIIRFGIPTLRLFSPFLRFLKYFFSNDYFFKALDGFNDIVHSGIPTLFKPFPTGTYKWAQESGFSEKEANTLAWADSFLDQRKIIFVNLINFKKIFPFYKSKHEDMRPYDKISPYIKNIFKEDSRLAWAKDMFNLAVKTAIEEKDPKSQTALKYLGKGLHSLQDFIAHNSIKNERTLSLKNMSESQLNYIEDIHYADDIDDNGEIIYGFTRLKNTEFLTKEYLKKYIEEVEKISRLNNLDLLKILKSYTYPDYFIKERLIDKSKSISIKFLIELRSFLKSA